MGMPPIYSRKTGQLGKFDAYSTDALFAPGHAYLMRRLTGQDPGEMAFGKPPEPPALPNAPGPAPDATDAYVQAAARRERDNIQTKRGRRSTFLTGEPGDVAYGKGTVLGGF